MMLLLAAVESILLERNVTMFAVGPAMAFFMKNYYGIDEKCFWYLVVDTHDLSCCLVMVTVLLPCTLSASTLAVFWKLLWPVLIFQVTRYFGFQRFKKISPGRKKMHHKLNR